MASKKKIRCGKGVSATSDAPPIEAVVSDGRDELQHVLAQIETRRAERQRTWQRRLERRSVAFRHRHRRPVRLGAARV
jgi:hypothetical protein